jgi:DUF1680 family protein
MKVYINKFFNYWPVLLVLIFGLAILTSFSLEKKEQSENTIIENQWKQIKTIDEGGLIGERVDLWRNHRLWNIGDSDYIIDGFENRPGMHPWQGEHLGKWLHAATLAYNISGNKKLKLKLDEMVKRLLATQLKSGYLGTYGQGYTFMALPENDMKTELADDIQPTKKKINSQGNDKAPGGGWDTWTIRYNIYGLLTYEKYFPNKEVLDACKKMGDLLIEYYGEGKYDLSKYGTRQGISATTLLESIVMLYERTLDKKYLDFAERIVKVSEENPKHRLMGTMLEKGSVVYPGDGKGYQLMANLLGYLNLYRCTGNEKYLNTTLNGWQEIQKKHVLTTGGPWTRKMPYNGNKECFAHQEAFNPEKIVVEGCNNATWMQLNIHLFELTGNAKYFSEAEVALLNSTYGHQYSDGIEWCYYMAPNEDRPKYEPRFHCCGSSQPRGMEMYSNHLAGIIDSNLSINTFSASKIEIPNQFGSGTLNIESGFPLKQSSSIFLNPIESKAFTLEFRLPLNTAFKQVLVNNKKVEILSNDRGFYELNRKWKKGDEITIDYNYELKATIQDGEKGKKWVAFSYGPIALAQKVDKMAGDEPFLNIDFTNPNELLGLLVKSAKSDIEFTIKETSTTLIPYYQTGTKQSGPKTYFTIKN